jgi:conjugative transfer region protein TrbK
MSLHLTPGQYARAAAGGLIILIVALVVIQSRRGEDTAVLAPLGGGEADALASELARCRMIASDDIAALETCRRAWAENRQHFFMSAKPPQPQVGSLPNGSIEAVKGQDRVMPNEVVHQNSNREVP